MTDQMDATTTTVEDYHIRLEEYDNYVACTIVGSHTPSDVVAVGDALYPSWALLKPVYGILPLPWGLARLRISTDVDFHRYDSPSHPALTYEFRADTNHQIGVIASTMQPVRQALDQLLDDAQAADGLELR